MHLNNGCTSDEDADRNSAIENPTQYSIFPPVNRSRYCLTNGLTEETGSCDAGYYCTSGAEWSAPVDQTYGGPCTKGHYCEEGTAYPEPCPVGTYYDALVNTTMRRLTTQTKRDH